MRWIFLLLLVFFTLISSTFSQSNDDTQTFQVEYRGALRDIMHKGDISGKVNLSDFNNSKNLYALGAVAGLKGEILIIDSKPVISSVKSGRLVFNNSFNHKATLLVYASVPKWNSFEIPASVSTYSELESFIENKAGEIGLDTGKPFPFLIEGKVNLFDWHVIDWKEGDTEHSHEKHKNSGLKGTEVNREVEILGFYSKNHQGVFTHKSTNMHLHVRTLDGDVSGHLDGVILGDKMSVLLPGK